MINVKKVGYDCAFKSRFADVCSAFYIESAMGTE